MAASENLSGKSSSRITINSFMMGSLFVILTLMFTLGTGQFGVFIMAQLILAIPLLFFSSLFYAKISYREETRLFDKGAWLTSTLGNTFILNVGGLMAGTFSKTLAFIYFPLVMICIISYYAINIYYKKDSFKEDFLKALMVLLILAIGGIYPMLIA